MDQEELHTQILMRDYLERQELKASAIATNHCVDMESDELGTLCICFLLGQLEEKQEQMNRVLESLSEFKSASKEQGKLLERISCTDR